MSKRKSVLSAREAWQAYQAAATAHILSPVGDKPTRLAAQATYREYKAAVKREEANAQARSGQAILR